MTKLINILIMALTIATGGAEDHQATYRIDFSGQRAFYCADKGEGKDYVLPKEEYREGEEVVLYYTMVATDTVYTFLLDGEPVNPEGMTEMGYVIRFIMPAHDVKLECHHRNIMTNQTN